MQLSWKCYKVLREISPFDSGSALKLIKIKNEECIDFIICEQFFLPIIMFKNDYMVVNVV